MSAFEHSVLFTDTIEVSNANDGRQLNILNAKHTLDWDATVTIFSLFFRYSQKHKLSDISA